EFRVRHDLAFLGRVTAGHVLVSSFLFWSWPGLSRPSTSFPSRDPRVPLRAPGDTAQRGRLLRPLCSVLRTALPAGLCALPVEPAAQDVVAHPGESLDAGRAGRDGPGCLRVMAFAPGVTASL